MQKRASQTDGHRDMRKRNKDSMFLFSISIWRNLFFTSNNIERLPIDGIARHDFTYTLIRPFITDKNAYKKNKKISAKKP